MLERSKRAVRALVVVVLLGLFEISAHGVAELVNAGEELAEPARLPGSISPTAQQPNPILVDRNDSRPWRRPRSVEEGKP
jgi:hypothetical protein